MGMVVGADGCGVGRLVMRRCVGAGTGTAEGSELGAPEGSDEGSLEGTRVGARVVTPVPGCGRHAAMMRHSAMCAHALIAVGMDHDVGDDFRLSTPLSRLPTYGRWWNLRAYVYVDCTTGSAN